MNWNAFINVNFSCAFSTNLLYFRLIDFINFYAHLRLKKNLFGLILGKENLKMYAFNQNTIK